MDIVLPTTMDESDGASDVELPSDVEESDPEMPELLTPSESGEIAELGGFRLREADHDIAEYYSRPRLLQIADKFGLYGKMSKDLVTGIDFTLPLHRQQSLDDLDKHKVQFLMLSPPCTSFSRIQHLWNFGKMDPQKEIDMKNEGMIHLRHSIECAQRQVLRGRRFCLEHPSGASSWTEPDMLALLALPDVRTLTFDQCMVGLVTMVNQEPVRKRTKFATNCPHVYANFHQLKCDKSHSHCVLQGSEGGVKRTAFAQCYPPPMVNLLLKSAAGWSSGVV